MSMFFHRAVRAAVNTSPGNQTFTHGTLTEVPKFARLTMTIATADDTLTNEASIGRGFATADKQYAFANKTVVLPGSPPVDWTNVVWSSASKTACMSLLTDAGALTAVATFVSFGAGSITINWTTAPAAAYLLTIELYGGDAYEVSCVEGVDTDYDLTPGTAVTLFGSAADNDTLAGFFTGTAAGVFDESPNNTGLCRMGVFAGNGATITQGGICWYDKHGTGFGTNLEVSIVTANSYVDSFHVGVSILDTLTVTNVTSTTATAQTSGSAMPGAVCLWVAMRLTGSRGLSAKVVAFSNSSTSANQVLSGVGFAPTAAISLSSMAGSLNTLITSASAEGFGTGGWNKSGETFCNSIHSKDGSTPLVVKSRASTKSYDATIASTARSRGVFNVAFNDGVNFTGGSSAGTRYNVVLFLAPPPGIVMTGGVELKGGVVLG